MKVLITEGTQVNFNDDKGAQHVDAAEMPDVTKDTAQVLTSNGRALYINKADDPNKDGRYTASAEMIKAAQALSAEKAKAAQAAKAE